MKNGMHVHDDGSTSWFKEGKLHREDGPAVEWKGGDKTWYKEGKRHRLDGPAVENSDGYKAWYKDDKLHRLDGPAVEHSSGMKKWYIEGHLVYGEYIDNTDMFEMSDKMKRQIIKYKLERMQ